MTARDTILNRIRTALGAGSGRAPGTAPSPDVPRGYRTTGRYAPGDPHLVRLLTERLRGYRATVTTATPDRLPTALATELARILPRAGRVVLPPGLPPQWGLTGGAID